jgi:hypothetical protein
MKDEIIRNFPPAPTSKDGNYATKREIEARRRLQRKQLEQSEQREMQLMTKEIWE